MLIISNEPVDLVNRLQIALFNGELDLTLNVCAIYGAKCSSLSETKVQSYQWGGPSAIFFSGSETRTFYFIF